VEHIRSVIRFLDIDLDRTQESQLDQFADWLRTEGIRAGAIGPDEGDRIERRHIADSLLFAVGIPSGTREVWDLGTGVGLPGVPLAIALPDTRFVLIDRSGRRVDLLRRFLRIANLTNCQVIQGEIDDLTGEVGVIVARASLPPAGLSSVGERLLVAGGVMIVGGSWLKPPNEVGWDLQEIPRYVLDQPIWLLMMRRA
jgi:16S rRNA (guanine527-N7)-methyltransferase